mgnify:FL=1
MNIVEINERIKQRPPFQMIERVVELEPNVSAKGIKCVSVNEPYFMGHFPDAPIMPGVLIIESAAQLCSLVIAPENAASDADKLYVLLKVKDFKFLKPVIPGDKLEIEVKCTLASAAAYEFSAIISVDGKTRAKGSMLFTAIDKSTVYE